METGGRQERDPYVGQTDDELMQASGMPAMTAERIIRLSLGLTTERAIGEL